MMENCKKCGASLGSGDRFCMQCGTLVLAATESVTSKDIPEETVTEVTRTGEDAPAEPAAVATPPETPGPEGAEATGAEATEAAAATEEAATPSYMQPGFQNEFQENANAAQQSAPSAYGQAYGQQQSTNQQQPYTPAYAPTHAHTAPAGRPSENEHTKVLGLSGFLGALLLFHIPVAGFIIAICFACGACKNKNKVNLARAVLIFWAIMFVVILLVVTVLASVGAYFMTRYGYDFFDEWNNRYYSDWDNWNDWDQNPYADDWSDLEDWGRYQSGNTSHPGILAFQ